MKLTQIIGFTVGLILIVIPEPSTTLLGLAIVGYTSYKMGWLGKG